MSTDVDPGLITAWNTTPNTKPGPLTRLRDRLFGPDHTGAADTWSPANDLAAGDHRPDRLHPVNPDHGLTPAAFQYATGTHQQVHAGPDDATGIWQAPRKPVAAITATPHFAFVDDHLGPLDLGPLEPAHIHNQLAGAAR